MSKEEKRGGREEGMRGVKEGVGDRKKKEGGVGGKRR